MASDAKLYCLLELEPFEGKVRLEMQPQKLKPGVKYLVCRKLAAGQKATKEDETPFYIPHSSISRRHAILWCKPHVEGGLELRIRDNATTNGTFVNGERLEPGGMAKKIVGGDGTVFLRFGEIPHKFRAWCVVGGEETKPKSTPAQVAPKKDEKQARAARIAAEAAAKAERLAKIEERLAAVRLPTSLANKGGSDHESSPRVGPADVTPDVLGQALGNPSANGKGSPSPGTPDAFQSPVVHDGYEDPAREPSPVPAAVPEVPVVAEEPPAGPAPAAAGGKRSTKGKRSASRSSSSDVSSSERRLAAAVAAAAAAATGSGKKSKEGTKAKAAKQTKEGGDAKAAVKAKGETKEASKAKKEGRTSDKKDKVAEEKAKAKDRKASKEAEEPTRANGRASKSRDRRRKGGDGAEDAKASRKSKAGDKAQGGGGRRSEEDAASKRPRKRDEPLEESRKKKRKSADD